MNRYPRAPRLHWAAKTSHSIQGELLNVGDSPVGFSNEDYATIGIDYATGMQAMLDGWNVRVAVAGSSFLGHPVEDTFLYLGVTVPKHFDRLKFPMLRVSQYLSENHNTTVKITAQSWWFDEQEGRSDKRGVKLWIEDIYETKKVFDVDDLIKLEINQVSSPSVIDPAALYRISQNKLRFYLEDIKQSEQDRITQREWDNRNNHQRTIWAIDDEVDLNGERYRVGRVDDLQSSWMLRLDRKFYPSSFLRVPK